MKLKTQILISIVTLIVLLTASLSGLFAVLMGASAKNQFSKRGMSVATSLASTGRLGVMMGDSSQLSVIMDAALLDDEVRSVNFSDPAGKTIASRGGRVNLLSAHTGTGNGVEQLEAEDEQGNNLGVFRSPVFAKHGDTVPIGSLDVAISTKNLRDDLRSTILWSVLLCVTFSLTAVVVVYLIMRILQPLLSGIQLVATGDLTVELEQKTHDEVGTLIGSLNELVKGLRTTVEDVEDVARIVAEQTGTILADSKNMEQGMQQQLHQSAEVVDAVEAMLKTIIMNSNNANSTASTAEEAKAAAEEGGRIVAETVVGMKRIATVVKQSAATVQELGKSSDQIGEIISVIDDIADQTNLLALNAAIEAARAGEQGRGFAVVADEVRKLAERTTKATKEIAAMIKKIQADTKGAVHSMEQGTLQVDEGIKLADKAGTSLLEIVGISQKVTDMVTQIAAASEEQSSASEQISKNVEAINSVTNESATATKQIAGAAEDLSRLTENLQQLIARFKFSGEGQSVVRPASREGLKFSRKTGTPKSNFTVREDGVLATQREGQGGNC